MKKAQILITFDDGTADHVDAAKELQDRNLHGTFGIVMSMVGKVGFMKATDLVTLKKQQHFVCNHSKSHKWLGSGPDKPGIAKHSREEVTKDYLEARGWLNFSGHHGDYLMTPFGTSNIEGDPHLKELLEHFKWIRLTIGAPLPDEQGMWTPAGGKRLYPSGYSGRVIGLTEAADVRRPLGVKNAVDNAIAAGSLAVILYRTVCHVVGETQMVTWDRFISDIDYIAEKSDGGELLSITPGDLV